MDYLCTGAIARFSPITPAGSRAHAGCSVLHLPVDSGLLGIVFDEGHEIISLKVADASGLWEDAISCFMK